MTNLAMMQRFFPDAEYSNRWERVHAEMERRGLDIAVVWGRTVGTYERSGDIVYLANYTSGNSGQIPTGIMDDACEGVGFSAVILERGEKPELIADEEPYPHLIATDRFRWSYYPFPELIRALKERPRASRVGFVGTDFIPMRYWEQLKEGLPGVEWVFCDDLVLAARVIKSPRELEAYRIAGKSSTAALTALMDALQNGASEAEAASRAVKEIVAAGGWPHYTPVNTNARNIQSIYSRPMPGFSDRIPKQGDLTVAWVYGNTFEGYWLDPGRTFVIGNEPDEGQRELIDATAAIVNECMKLCTPGRSIDEIIALGESMTRAFEESAGGHSNIQDKWPLFGHGVGMMWEPPTLSRYYNGEYRTIEENMVMSTEAFLYHPDVGVAGFENNFIITADGPELLTDAPM